MKFPILSMVLLVLLACVQKPIEGPVPLPEEAAVVAPIIPQTGPLQISNARIVLPNSRDKFITGYASFKNETDKAIQLKVSKAENFKSVELHETIGKGKAAKMKSKAQVEVAAQKNFVLDPGASHLMFYGADKTLKAGDKIQVTFLIDGKPTDFEFSVTR